MAGPLQCPSLCAGKMCLGWRRQQTSGESTTTRPPLQRFFPHSSLLGKYWLFLSPATVQNEKWIRITLQTAVGPSSSVRRAFFYTKPDHRSRHALQLRGFSALNQKSMFAERSRVDTCIFGISDTLASHKAS